MNIAGFTTGLRSRRDDHDGVGVPSYGKDGKYRIKNRECRVPKVVAALSIPCFLLLALFLSATPAFARPPVGMQIEPLSIRGRSGGPIALRIKLDYSESLLREGNLFLRIYHGTPNTNRRPTEDDLICTLRYDGIVLQGTDYFFRTILPPIEHAGTEQYEIEAWFETDSQRIPLSSDEKQLDPPEPHDLLSVGTFERATVLCSCSGDLDFQSLSATRRFLNDVLSLDNYNPLGPAGGNSEGSNVGMRSRRINNYAPAWDARDLPEDPLALCSFDVVLLADGSVGKLQPAQMDALKTWVQAGGSLCVMPNDERMDGRHLAFLQELFEVENDAGVALSLTDEGELLLISEETDPIILRHVGLGRVALLPDVEDISQRLSQPDLGRLAAHLWKARKDSTIAEGQRWRVRDLEALMQEQNVELRQEGGYYYLAPTGPVMNYTDGSFYNKRFLNIEDVASKAGVGAELFPRSSDLVDVCSEVLMPSGVEMVPTWVIAAILAAYVVTIGPVDYLVLGFFRLRRLTWVLFPIVTAFYTLLTVYTANAYMATTETGRRLVITDVIDDGHAVRETAVQLHFYGSQRTLTTPATSEFIVPSAALSETDPATAGYNRPGPDALRTSQRAAVLNYSGRFPQAYSVDQTLQQWSPKTARSMTLSAGETPVPSIPWNDVSLVTTEDGRGQLATLLRELDMDGQECAGAIVLHHNQRFPVPVGSNLFEQSRVASAEQLMSRIQEQNWHYAGAVDSQWMLAAGLVHATQSPPQNFFGIVSQVSPQGSGTLEDLAFLDPSDPEQWALVVLMLTEHGYHVYRKLYVMDQ